MITNNHNLIRIIKIRIHCSSSNPSAAFVVNQVLQILDPFLIRILSFLFSLTFIGYSIVEFSDHRMGTLLRGRPKSIKLINQLGVTSNILILLIFFLRQIIEKAISMAFLSHSIIL